MSNRAEIIAKVRDAIEEALLEHEGTYVGVDEDHWACVDGDVDITNLAEAAFDAIADEWSPPF
ncbi:hypothetical protein FDI14_gp081 [Mycobacterium phage SirDuracell]|uniref:Uncharacterized protein n=3 Tax=Caudoviricetes TaxID=2731619 RepID=G1D5U6_9CAUD|nr:hypothetical protein FDG56_gp082 [Mycobacterium phage Bask21]YP_009608011.1 hypothetical protein FDI14_gp081 [Mycobacterium phage SirDuracell]AEJ92601.1 hypothetical protein SEA_RAKIM_83 [Mycobacterium phage Rakim]AVE00126.1 hypothetical protein SEA_KIMCHI_86 [Mycobacterium phage Kimchi]AVI03978.1 hypothetical protein SEA_GAGE_84 [Mycobacterium phage Gage]AVI04536.1 hypothetical protein SEA_SOTRICE96_83 [Mycobacterium phage Sotrice96]AXC37462.1 hypothetical protein SEA_DOCTORDIDDLES_81 [My